MSDKSAGESLIETGFHLDSIVSIADPSGGDASWFRYVISQGAKSENAITGRKSGSRMDVQLQVDQMVARLNERFGKLQAKTK